MNCGCKICKQGLGELVNDLVVNGESPKFVITELQHNGLKVSEKLLRKHLSAFELTFSEAVEAELLEPVQVDLNKIDFSIYEFDNTDIESFVGYIQNINKKIYLNQARIVLQAQQDVINGVSPDVPKEILQNLAIAFQILDKSTGMSLHINQQQAIKVVEGMGLSIQSQPIYLPQNVENKPESKAN